MAQSCAIACPRIGSRKIVERKRLRQNRENYRQCNRSEDDHFASRQASALSQETLFKSNWSSLTHFPLGFQMPLAIGFRSAHRIKQDIQVANGGHHESVMNSLSPNRALIRLGIDHVSDFSHNIWNGGAAHDSHDHYAGAISGKRAKFSDAQREDARKHDGVEEAHQQNGPHGYGAIGQD